MVGLSVFGGYAKTFNAKAQSREGVQGRLFYVNSG
jgi:hypothetical protein